MPSKVENALHEAFEAPLGARQSRRPSRLSKPCILTVHDEGWCKQTVLVSPDLFQPEQLRRTVLQIVPAQNSPSGSPGHRERHTGPSKHPGSPHFVFALEPVSSDILSGYPSLEVSILRPIAAALGFANRSKILITEVEADDHLASHVEISFKDAYLTRADMWRLLTSDLVGTSIYKNQKVLFINSVKANVKAIYANGRRVQSALLDASTKAIFRSDSSRYYILLQMSREMWDFDSDGGGEIMFDKVIKGFLPELFRRWEALGTSHSVSVILFTRMEYEHQTGTLYQDYYRVLTTELMSSESATILYRLKEEFRIFLRDVSTVHSSSTAPSDAPSGVTPVLDYGKIEGRPVAAIHGNILEAIHTAALQFLRSNATCDLRRTGLSVIVITPGTGVYEVEHDLLIRTTDLLIDNGIYIDLVCLSRMPLHSSPLFRYKTARQAVPNSTSTSNNKGAHDFVDWEYTIPHWVDVSFWQDHAKAAAGNNATSQLSRRLSQQKKFTPRVRMYEVQMTGLMQNEFSIAISHLPCPYSVRFPKSFGLDTKMFKPKASTEVHDLEGAKAVYNQGYKELNNSASPDKSASQLHMQPFTELLNWMDDYDECAYKKPKSGLTDPSVLQKPPPGKARDALETKAPQGHLKSQAVPHPLGLPTTDAPTNLPKRKTSSASTSSKFRSPSAKLNPFSRQFGPGFLGFGTAKAVATTKVSAEPVVSNAATTKASPEPSISSRTSSHVEHSFPASSTLSRPSTRASALSPSVSNSELGETVVEKSRPIDIAPKHHKTPSTNPRDERELAAVDSEQPLLNEDLGDREEAVTETNHKPVNIKSPWTTMLNPSNPKTLTGDMTSRLGRWQHVFPKPTQASTIKWKSLCSPACVPLTTEEFPSSQQLRSEYSSMEYEVMVTTEKDGNETENSGEWLIRELIASRLTRGFSVVVGTRPAEALELPQAQWFEFLHEKGMSRQGVKIVLSRGAEIHELFNLKEGVVKVTCYIRNEGRPKDQSDGNMTEYTPFIRTAYSSNYVRRKFSLLSKGTRLDWEQLDRFIANDEEGLNKPYPESLQYWRARFVLIPIAVSGARKRNHSPEDNEEEIRLEGIRKLTQMWQRNRHIPRNERKFESKTRKDTNPLDIVYQTRPVSAIVLSELKDTILTDPEHKSTQLLPEKELFERAKLNVVALSKTLQGDKGVRLMDRRWHWRLHYNCFIGMELTTWLVNNFRDIDTRDEAVDFGNELMKEGLFVHVERRHNFRDGNFFYQIAEKYRAPRQDVRSSWFGRLADRSVPATPLIENYSEEAKGLRPPSTIVSEPESESDDEPSGEGQDDDGSRWAPQSKAKHTSVVLSKQLVYDMDQRKKSHRRELVHLHVDRISSADDCYHIRIDWVTATPKLIEDMVETWATTAERSGLRLVEVPLLEARRFTDSHPFRHPYYIKLAKDPPQQPPHAASAAVAEASSPPAGMETGTAAEQTVLQPPSQQQSPSWPYHKAILKKFDFVLDLEAANDFPSEVSVQYSWGAPDYRLPQYITRSGRLLAQITPDGRFLLLINQLYAERGAAAREAQRTAAGAGGSSLPSRGLALKESDGPGQQITPRRAPITSGSAASAGINKLSLSPFASPLLHAAAAAGPPDVQLALAMPQSSAVASSSGRTSSSSPRLQQTQPPLSRSELLTITQLRIELEAFCNDADALGRFYEEELHRPLATVPATPVVKPFTALLGNEEAASAIPPTLSLREDTKNEEAGP